MILPAALKAGDTVAALSLSWGGPGALPGRYPAGKAQLEREYGVTVVELPLTLQKPAYVAAHPELRAADLHAALRDPAIAGIVSTIGGDDSIRMLPYLDLDLIARSVRNLAGEHRRLDRRALSVGEPAPADAGAQAGPVEPVPYGMLVQRPATGFPKNWRHSAGCGQSHGRVGAARRSKYLAPARASCQAVRMTDSLTSRAATPSTAPAKPLRVLIVGGGGRDHALAHAFARSPLLGDLHAVPGNGGIAELGTCYPDIDPNDFAAVAELARAIDADLAVIGAEDLLVAGLTDVIEAAGIAVFGPRMDAAQLEGSKVFSKTLMDHLNIPTAEWRACSTPDEARAAVAEFGGAAAVKANGLALGCGAYVCFTPEAAEAAITTLMVDQLYGAAGATVIVERLMDGGEGQRDGADRWHARRATAGCARLQAPARR